jgi:hypothetical protein
VPVDIEREPALIDPDHLDAVVCKQSSCEEPELPETEHRDAIDAGSCHANPPYMYRTAHFSIIL